MATEPVKDSGNSIDTKNLLNLNGFTFTRVLNLLTRTKDIFVLGRFQDQPEDEQSILLINKDAISANAFTDNSFQKTQLAKDFTNDVYEKYLAQFPTPFCGGKITVIRPATETHISKYSAQNYGFIHETVDMFQKATKPYIEAKSLSQAWVCNILDGKAEQDRILFKDPGPDTGFILMPDLKWDTSDVSALYLLAIVMRRDIHSIRDLNSSHILLLENIRSKSYQFISDKYGYAPHQIRCFIHYQPSYYHFHVHVTYIGYEAPGSYIGKAHLLEDVIDNLKIFPEYYAKKTLSFILPVEHQLFKSLSQI